MGGECSGGFHPLGDLSSGCVFHLLLRMAKRGIPFVGMFLVYLGGLRFEVNGRRPELDRWWRSLIDISKVEEGIGLCRKLR